MTIRNLEQLLAPQSIALIGASAREGSVGRQLAANLTLGGFGGPIHFVNPNRPTVLGRQAAGSLAELAHAPDLAVVATPPQTIPALISELGRIGTRAAIVISAGVRDDLRQKMLDAARPTCLRILGPNCIGLMVPGLGLNASFSHMDAPRGDLAFVSQSGALITAIVDWAAGRAIGFSHVVSLGDMADVDFGDMLDYLAGDTTSRAILIYMEALTAAAKFMSAARRAARAKPVIIIKSGRHAAGAKAARSHSGALAGSDAAYDAAFRRAGLLRVLELEDLFNAAEMLSRAPRLEGERLAIVTNGGGAGVLAADRLADFDGHLAHLSEAAMAALNDALPPTWSMDNPIDIIGDADETRYRNALDIVLQDSSSDAVLAINCPTAVASSVGAARAVVAAATAHRDSKRPAKPILVCWLGEASAPEARTLFAEHAIPSFTTPENAVEGFMQLVCHARAQYELMRTPPSLGEGLNVDRMQVRGIIAGAIAAGRSMLSEDEGKAILAAYAIPTVETAVAETPFEVRDAVARILEKHHQAVIKILSDDISHKSDVGGVHLGILSATEGLGAATEMLERVRSLKPGARVRGFTVQPMINRPGAHELIIGMAVDATFGPMVLFGAGGTKVEALADTSLALPPLDLKLASDLVHRTRVCRLLCGYRDQPAADIGAVALTLVKISQLVADHPEIRELDINPVLADASGVIALDARLCVEHEATRPRQPMALRPYPVEWEARGTLEGIGPIQLRPIRPDDEQLYQRFFEHVTLEDARRRFFTPVKGLSHKYLARLTQIDYAREMAFIAVSAAQELLGVARLVADPDYRRAEYGILVRSDLKARGLGWRLMQHLMDYARAEGLKELYGTVLAENTTMLSMCRELGFDITIKPDEPNLRTVRFELGKAT